MSSSSVSIPLEKLDDNRFCIPKSFCKDMRVAGMIYANEKLLKDILKDKALEQVVNVATLPGIVGYSMAMPDIHWGYGFPIGGVAATDIKGGGVISPGGVGFDINCGVRLIRSDFKVEEIQKYLKDLVNAFFRDVPSGVGSTSDLRLDKNSEKQLLVKGAQWVVSKGFGTKDDLDATEDFGAIPDANPDVVSGRAYQRGREQIGTLGSGNHFLELQVVEEIFDERVGNNFGLFPGQVMIMIHCGSRGLGYQICEDYCRDMMPCLQKYAIQVPDRQLVCAPVDSVEGQSYLGAMRCAANYAWANRQYIMHSVRESFQRIFKKSWQSMGLRLIYDVAHNIAKIETHEINGQKKRLCVHRKGATRAFPPGHPDLPEHFKQTGQPVIVPGDMGRHSYLMVGTESSRESWYSCCHGAGRVMSRSQAMKKFNAHDLLKDFESKGIVVQAHSKATLTEEAPGVYKDVTDVVDVVHNAGLAKKVCRLKPLGVVKG